MARPHVPNQPAGDEGSWEAEAEQCLDAQPQHAGGTRPAGRLWPCALCEAGHVLLGAGEPAGLGWCVSQNRNGWSQTVLGIGYQQPRRCSGGHGGVKALAREAWDQVMGKQAEATIREGTSRKESTLLKSRAFSREQVTDRELVPLWKGPCGVQGAVTPEPGAGQQGGHLPLWATPPNRPGLRRTTSLNPQMGTACRAEGAQ